MGKKVFFGNYKGGVGKTTSTYNIGVELAKAFDKRVLLIDLDPQSSLSNVCMTARNQSIDELGRNETLNYIYTVYMQARRIGNINFHVDSKKIIKSVNSIDFIPNSLFSELADWIKSVWISEKALKIYLYCGISLRTIVCRKSTISYFSTVLLVIM